MDTETQDAEANLFALELLMPFDWIVKDAAGVDLTDDAAIEKLAKKYGVPAATMAIRIGQIYEETLSKPAPALTSASQP